VGSGELELINALVLERVLLVLADSRADFELAPVCIGAMFRLMSKQGQPQSKAPRAWTNAISHFE
jgi:hypothetical protein